MIHKRHRALAFVLLGLLLIQTACNKHYWFRKKVNVTKDSTEVEKDFKIVW